MDPEGVSSLGDSSSIEASVGSGASVASGASVGCSICGGAVVASPPQAVNRMAIKIKADSTRKMGRCIFFSPSKVK
jgi:hypothetical protein